jgi:hypothetical protein
MNRQKSFIYFLEDIATNIFPETASDVQKLCFWLRFHPDNRELENTKIAGLIKTELNGGFSESSINPILGDVIKKIKDKCGAQMQADGIDIAKLTPGRGKPKEAPWKIVCDWFRMKWIWQTLVEKADKHCEWIDFLNPELRNGIVIPQPRQQRQLQVKAPYLMRIELQHSSRNLLLLNQGWTTKYVLTPSIAFAPKWQLDGKPMWIPQDGSILQEYNKGIEFDTPGKEEFVGIVLDEDLDFDWLDLREDNHAPTWDETRLSELWSYLECKENWQVFYQCFEVVG